MDLTLTNRGDILIVQVVGAVESTTTGLLYDTLAKSCGEGCMKMIVDLSGATRLTHAGLRGVIVAAKLLRSAGGEMRIHAADDRAQAMLTGLGFNHLLRCEPTLEAAVTALSPQPARPILHLSEAQRPAPGGPFGPFAAEPLQKAVARAEK